jgi:hypothetical protein
MPCQAIDVLAKGVDVRLQHVVKQVEVKDGPRPGSGSGSVAAAETKGKESKDSKDGKRQHVIVHTDRGAVPALAYRSWLHSLCIRMCLLAGKFEADFCVVTLPLGVLKVRLSCSL